MHLSFGDLSRNSTIVANPLPTSVILGAANDGKVQGFLSFVKHYQTNVTIEKILKICLGIAWGRLHVNDIATTPNL